MGSLRRVAHRLAHRGARAGPDDRDAIASARDSILLLIGQLRAAKRHAAGAFARRAGLETVLRDQFGLLDRAREQARAAITAADSAAASARESSDPQLAAYELTADGLRTQLAVLDAAAEQLAGFGGRTRENLDQARRVMAANIRSLDAALREQVSLLSRLERLERRRVIEDVRRHGGEAERG